MKDFCEKNYLGLSIKSKFFFIFALANHPNNRKKL